MVVVPPTAVDPKTWKPKRTYAECDRLLKAPGSPCEVEDRYIVGRIQRVFKNLAPSTRHLWLTCSSTHSNKTYLVFENERITYGEMHQRASKAADVFRTVYGIQKGDRIAIVMRNFPDWVVAWWASQLLGAVPVCVNAWLPADIVQFCIEHTDSKIVVLDPERATLLENWLSGAISAGRSCVQEALVVRHWEEPGRVWKGIKKWDDVMDNYLGPREAWKQVADILPEDDAVIFFTSGTTGMPKGVLSTHRGFLTNIPCSFACRARAALRNGLDLPKPDPLAPQITGLLTTPLFHVTGTTAVLMLNTMAGSRLCLLRKWDREVAADLIRKENIQAVSGVPFIAMDLAESSLGKNKASQPTMNWTCGGAPPSDSLAAHMKATFPNTAFMQGYGLTEINCLAAGTAGMDYLLKPASTGLPSPVNDVIIVDTGTGKVLPAGQPGEVWIRGPNVMKCYWKNPKATAEAITPDGWLKTGDMGSLDDEGYLYIRDRIKDIIIRGGENIDSTTIENALYKDHRILDCAAIGVPDDKLGELPIAVVSVKDAYKGGRVKERELIAFAKGSLPAFAIPVMVLISDSSLPRNAAGKVMKAELRAIAKREWRRRIADNTIIQARL